MNRARARGCGWPTAALAALTALLALAAALPAGAHAARGLELGFSDELYSSPSERDFWLDRTVAQRADRVKLVVRWNVAATRKPANPTDPSDPAYSFTELDDSVRAAEARGLDVILFIVTAPQWAEGAGRPADIRPGTWKPDPTMVGQFATALARRYSGAGSDEGGRPLPAVRDFQLWGEANLDFHLSPQYEKGEPFAAPHYRSMLAATSTGIKSVHPGNRLISSGLSPYGDDPGSARTRPLEFLRQLFCLKGRKRLVRDPSCSGAATFDIFAAHAINTSGPPTQSAIHPDDASSGDLGAMKKTVRAAEKLGTIGGPRRHPLWVTEYWWSTNPPDNRGVSPKLQARYVTQTLHMAWTQGYAVALQHKIRDTEPHQISWEIYADGLFYVDGGQKPSAKAYRFPFAAERVGRKKVSLWGMAPAKGRVTIEWRSRKGWKRLANVKAGGNRVFAGKARLKGNPKLRAKAKGETSPPWKASWSK